jgi:hypothetical protein
VPRASVSHVDHPGNWLVAVGALLVVMGISIAAEDRQPQQTEEEYRNGRRVALGMFAAPGLLMVGWGGFTWTRSRLRERRRGPVRERRLPIVVPADVVLAPGTPLAPPPPPAPAVPGLPIVP